MANKINGKNGERKRKCTHTHIQENQIHYYIASLGENFHLAFSNDENQVKTLLFWVLSLFLPFSRTLDSKTYFPFSLIIILCLLSCINKIYVCVHKVAKVNFSTPLPPLPLLENKYTHQFNKEVYTTVSGTIPNEKGKMMLKKNEKNK